MRASEFDLMISAVKLQEDFTPVTNKYKMFEALPDYNFLIQQYKEPFRFYHNLDHISIILSGFHSAPEVKQLNDAEAFELFEAIWRHDVFYHIPAKDKSNEELSALHHLKMNPQSLRAAEAIRATEFHFNGSTYEDPIINLMLDFDLLAFTWDYGRFVATNLNIDKEFEYTSSPEEVAPKRIKFMKSVWDNRSLKFRILADRVAMEERAYANIEKWLQQKGAL